MGLLNIFAGKSPADYERKGDALAQGNAWGEAKLAFGAALEKLAKQSPADPEMNRRLLEKLHHSKEALAMSHHREAMGLMEAGCMEDAHELLALAMDLTDDAQLKAALAQQIEQTVCQDVSEIQYPAAVLDDPFDAPASDPMEEDDDDHFNILLGALPEKVTQVYRSYGHEFKQGYLALNQGDFDQAVAHLTQAAEDHPEPDSLVPLELATAYVNMGQTDTAQGLLEVLVANQPDLLPAFQLLCEIYWDSKDYDKAMGLLDSLAPELAESMGAYLLKGETFLQAARNEEANSYFQGLLDTFGWHEATARGLARALEALGSMTQARDIYGQLIAQCSGCGSRVDPLLKRKYADLSFAAGDHTTKVMEYYFSLCQEDPANASQYCQNISHIYATQGNDLESGRFRSIAEDLVRRQESAK